jgi:hypothetical protein
VLLRSTLRISQLVELRKVTVELRLEESEKQINRESDGVCQVNAPAKTR